MEKYEEENTNERDTIQTFNVEQSLKNYKEDEMTCKSFFSFAWCSSSKETKNDYIEKWKLYLEKEGHENSNAPFSVLTKLYARPDSNEEVINELGNIRLNPNFASNNHIRNDLEFYIPQLCTFLLFGEMAEIEEFFVFLCKLCSASFFFAHRIYWFLLSLTNVEEKSKDIINIIKMICTLFISATDKKTLSNIYLSYSNGFMKYIKNNDMYFLYSNEKPFEIPLFKLDSLQTELVTRYKETREKIDKYSLIEYEAAQSKEKLTNMKTKTKLNADDFFIDIIKFNTINKPIYNQDEAGDFNLNPEINEDINFNSFISTPNFIEHLCDISDEMSALPKEIQIQYLYEALFKINLKLPANVYLPFLKESTRNYLICHIPIGETKIFRTKSRAPIMLTLELIKLNEVSNELLDKLNVVPILKDRSRSIATFNNNQSKLINSIDMEEDSDINISKPVKIAQKKVKEFEKKASFQKIKQEKMLFKSDIFSMKRSSTNILENEENTIQFAELDPEEESKINKLREQFKLRDQSINYNEVVDTKIKKNDSRQEEEEDTENKKEKSSSLVINNMDILNPNFSRYRSNTSLDTKKSSSNNHKNHIDHSSSHEISSQNEDQLNISNSSLDTSIQDDNIKNVFGELFDAQLHRLKQISPFGDLNSFKIFKAIVKTNEDLRQEQFATQLINEFYQIFQIEKVKCWLNTYEIIATGNRSGLIEMVPNSLSIDQLKQKTNNMSLRDFYLNYFGDGDPKSPHYKRAMKNFVRSLAGYSLVCYFLQIKDRHNGNILVDAEGHLIHIDFGFLLSNAPGKGLKFENAPFKLTKDMVDCLGGTDSDYFKKFRKRLQKGFIAVSDHQDKIVTLVEMMWCGHGKNLPCFQNQQTTITDLKNRLQPRGILKKTEKKQFVDNLIGESVDNWRTRWYDIFQYKVQGIFY